jgi:translation initiation factor 5A precursor (eIF-5A)
MDKRQTEVRTLKKGGYVIVDEEPCVIMGMTTSKPGKHGSAKARMDAIGIFDGQKRSIVQPVTAKIYVPIVERKTAQVIAISRDTPNLWIWERMKRSSCRWRKNMQIRWSRGKRSPT